MERGAISDVTCSQNGMHFILVTDPKQPWPWDISWHFHMKVKSSTRVWLRLEGSLAFKDKPSRLLWLKRLKKKDTIYYYNVHQHKGKTSPMTTSHPELGWDSNREVPGAGTGRYEALDVEVPKNRCVRGPSSVYILMFLDYPNFTKMLCPH